MTNTVDAIVRLERLSSSPERESLIAEAAALLPRLTCVELRGAIAGLRKIASGDDLDVAPEPALKLTPKRRRA